MENSKYLGLGDWRLNTADDSCRLKSLFCSDWTPICWLKLTSSAWKASWISMYNGSTNPKTTCTHVRTGIEDITKWPNIWCCIFRCTLTAIGWYRSINSFDELENLFRSAFNHKKRERKNASTLFNVTQGGHWKPSRLYGSLRGRCTYRR